MRSMQTSLSFFLLLTPAVCACSSVAGTDAAGTVRGGDSLLFDPCSGDGGGPQWRDLYQCYFGPNGAGCGGTNCHGSVDDDGTESSGFLCGPTADSCWQGMTQANPNYPVPIAIVPGGHTDAADTPLWMALRKPNPPTIPIPGTNNMPYMPVTYVFTQASLDRIQTWILDGAPNN
jgi:hypothetical protein